MKKTFLFILFTTIFILTGCTKSKLSTISLDELNTKLKNNESFILYIDVSSSSLEDKLETILTNNNLEGYILKDSKLSSEEKIKLQPTISYTDSSIVFIIDGKDPSILSHVTDDSTSIKDIELRLKDMNFIK